MTGVDVAAIRARLRAAVDQRWVRFYSAAQCADHIRTETTREWVAQFAATPHIAEFIAHAPTDIRTLLDALAVAERQRDDALALLACGDHSEPGCCSRCSGTGYSGDPSTGGSCWRRNKSTEIVYEDNGKPRGIPIEFADVMIGMFYLAELHGFDLLQAVEIKHRWNLSRSYPAEGRQLHYGGDR